MTVLLELLKGLVVFIGASAIGLFLLWVVLSFFQLPPVFLMGGGILLLLGLLAVILNKGAGK